MVQLVRLLYRNWTKHKFLIHIRPNSCWRRFISWSLVATLIWNSSHLTIKLVMLRQVSNQLSVSYGLFREVYLIPINLKKALIKIRQWTHKCLSITIQLKVPQTLRYQMELVPGELQLLMNMTLPEFIVTKCYLELLDQFTMHLVIVMQRLQTSFWISFFIPSICLILAAEITLFIDEVHFQVQSISSNLKQVVWSTFI